jgi:tetratricopeptide (TPR) repeat protein
VPLDERDRWLNSRRGALLRLLPGLDSRAAAQPPTDERYLAFEAVRALIEETAAASPVLLVLDDLHWGDAGSLRLLRHLVRHAAAARVLVAACVREDELSPATKTVLAALRAETSLIWVRLAGLDDDGVAALVADRTGTFDAPLARQLRERTAGNPFFLDELLRDREERGEGAAGPPPGVLDVVSRRIARLGPSAHEALSIAAVIGPHFDVGVVSLAGGREMSETLEALDGAVSAALVVPADAPARFSFAHALISETLLAALPMSRRAALHLRVADAIEQEATDSRAGQIAWHLRAAGPLASRERLVEWEVAAARQAARALAHEEAARHYEAALAALPADGVCAARTELLLSLGHAHDRAGRRDAARTAFRAAARGARERGNSEQLARAALGHGGLAVVIGAPEPEVTMLLDEALAAVPDSERATVARLRARLAVELSYADPARADELSGEAVDLACKADDPAAQAAALNARRVALWSPARAHERLATASAMIEAAHAAGDREASLQGHNWRVVDLMELGRVADASAEIDRYDALAHRVGLPHYRWYAPLWRACLAMLAGRWSEIAELGERALALGRQADDPNAPFLVRLQRVHALAQQRRFADVDRAWVAERTEDPLAGVAWKAGLALLDAELGNAASAHRLIGQFMRDGRAATLMNANWHAAGLLAEAAARIGDRAAAAVLYAQLAPHARLFPVVARGVACYGSAEYFAGRLAATLGRLDEAEVRLRDAVRENDSAGAAPRAALALASLGDVMTARGSYAAARDALDEAAARARALDMPVLAAQIRDALNTCPAA